MGKSVYRKSAVSIQGGGSIFVTGIRHPPTCASNQRANKRDLAEAYRAGISNVAHKAYGLLPYLYRRSRPWLKTQMLARAWRIGRAWAERHPAEAEAIVAEMRRKTMRCSGLIMGCNGSEACFCRANLAAKRGW